MKDPIRILAIFFVMGSSFIFPKYDKSRKRTRSVSLKTFISDSFLLNDLFLQSSDTINWPWPDSLDAVRAAPNSHKVLFENDKIRILEVTVDPYASEPMHTHRYPGVMFGPANDPSHYNIVYYRYGYDRAKHGYFAKDSILQTGGEHTHVKEAHFMNPEGPHSIRNLSNVKIIAYRVEFKQ